MQPVLLGEAVPAASAAAIPGARASLAQGPSLARELTPAAVAPGAAARSARGSAAVAQASSAPLATAASVQRVLEELREHLRAYERALRRCDRAALDAVAEEPAQERAWRRCARGSPRELEMHLREASLRDLGGGRFRVEVEEREGIRRSELRAVLQRQAGGAWRIADLAPRTASAPARARSARGSRVRTWQLESTDGSVEVQVRYEVVSGGQQAAEPVHRAPPYALGG